MALLTRLSEARTAGDQVTIDELTDALEDNDAERRILFWRIHESAWERLPPLIIKALDPGRFLFVWARQKVGPPRHRERAAPDPLDLRDPESRGPSRAMSGSALMASAFASSIPAKSQPSSSGTNRSPP